MLRRIVFTAVVAVFSLCVLVVPVAAQTTPSNDNFVSALELTAFGGKPIKISNVDLASNQVGEPAGCPGNYSVWFKFNFPIGGTVSLSSAGSFLPGPAGYSTDTSISVYTGGTLETLVQQACNDDGATLYGELPSFVFTANTTYYIRIAMLFAPTSGAYYLLTTRLRGVTGPWQLAGNSSFESGDLPPWKLVNKSGPDGVVCGSGASDGSCAFRFTNKNGEDSALQQAIKWPKYIKPQGNATLIMAIGVYNDEVVAPNVNVSLTIQYSDGTPSTVVKQAANSTAAMFNPILLATNFDSSNVKKVKVKVANKSTTGFTLVDNVTFTLVTGVIRDAAAAPLPLPVAAN